MTVALGASAYGVAIFHLMTHAFFKALLFLAAGSVIIAMHHEQDMRRMGGLKSYMPWTYWTLLIGAISSAGIPGFAGFYSKDAIIELTQHATLPGATFAYLCVLSCVFVTATYTFRLVFMAFHGAEVDAAHRRTSRRPSSPAARAAGDSSSGRADIGSVVSAIFSLKVFSGKRQPTTTAYGATPCTAWRSRRSGWPSQASQRPGICT
jgi:NADH:ubiquinone oxidoreductase subunit 5 (subunit L)/multisubunit Na+/H+ antiporter MnhA subunit